MEGREYVCAKLILGGRLCVVFLAGASVGDDAVLFPFSFYPTRERQEAFCFFRLRSCYFGGCTCCFITQGCYQCLICTSYGRNSETIVAIKRFKHTEIYVFICLSSENEVSLVWLHNNVSLSLCLF